MLVFRIARYLLAMAALVPIAGLLSVPFAYPLLVLAATALVYRLEREPMSELGLTPTFKRMGLGLHVADQALVVHGAPGTAAYLTGFAVSELLVAAVVVAMLRGLPRSPAAPAQEDGARGVR
ncbi:hypothetical protein [Nannocystis pusilla]|uniref:hypothetical protein n=1 Tax=Nannocystis pusilla TaxID=889268 RepID=UPI003BF03678